MRVYLASDHAGYELKVHLVNYLAKQGYEVVDIGPRAFDPEDDYPAFCVQTGLRVVADPGSLGVVIGGSGNGEQMAANKVPGIRAALAWSEETAALAREHNDANVVSLGGRMHTLDQLIRFVEVFLSTSCSGEERHARRIRQLADFESSGQLPPLPESARGRGPDA